MKVDVTRARNKRALSSEQCRQWIAAISGDEAEAILHDWAFWARPNQLEPADDWVNWAGHGGPRLREDPVY
jgi:hypothetical protein